MEQNQNSLMDKRQSKNERKTMKTKKIEK